MSNNALNDQDSGFVSRVLVIEDQPLESRAAAYAGMHDELAKRLDAPVLRSAGEDRA